MLDATRLDEDNRMNTPYKPHLDTPDKPDRCAQAITQTTTLKLARPLRQSYSVIEFPHRVGFEVCLPQLESQNSPFKQQ